MTPEEKEREYQEIKTFCPLSETAMRGVRDEYLANKLSRGTIPTAEEINAFMEGAEIVNFILGDHMRSKHAKS